MTTFVSLYQRFQEILAPEKKKVRERKAKKPEPTQRVILDKH